MSAAGAGRSDEETLRSYLRKATTELTELRGRVRELEDSAREPIAIVGMACRYPGEAQTPEALWRLVDGGVDAVAPFPADRGWDLEKLYDPDPDAPGTVSTRDGGFLRDVAEFDAEFFAISPREALAMDPQQRLMLEIAWEACEDGWIDPQSLHDTPTGVFAGVIHDDYGAGVDVRSMPAGTEGFKYGGTASSVFCGRIAYALGLQGPAVALDTACSSSLVALHLACQALRGGECSFALAGGVTVMTTTNLLTAFSRQRALSPDGRCKAFAAAADGVGFAEGAGVLLLERLGDALRHGHRVQAVIRGSAVNQDGASNGLTAPNGPSQERVIRDALAAAGLDPSEVDAVEAHGTGTPLGDPIEAQALLATYGRRRADGPLRLGSIKSNIGHTSAAAGVAGVIKMVMALRHQKLPRTLHLDAPSPHVDWSTGEVRLLDEAEPWAPGERPRRAGVSSFGASGTNAHLLIEEAPAAVVSAGGAAASVGAPAAPAGNAAPAHGAAAEAEAPAFDPDAATPYPLLLSAARPESLRRAAARLRERMLADPDLEPRDVAWTLARARAQLGRRAAAVGTDRGALLERLAAIAAGERAPGTVGGTAAPGKCVFVFPGQGAQWDGMATGLLDAAPVFSAAIAACEEALRPHVDWSLEAVLRGREGAPSLDRVDVVQPALWAMMVALAALWRSFGVKPAAVVGHSQGEIAAACVAGALSLEDGARVVALRSRAIAEELAGGGGMVSVAAPAAEVEPWIGEWGGRLSLAAYNAPGMVVVSGEPDALDQLLAACAERGVDGRRIAVDYASHSPQVEAIEGRLAEVLAPTRPRAAAIPFYSAADGGAVFEGTELGAGYWYRSLRESVRFEEATAALIDGGATTFVEVSPHPVLTFALQTTIDGRAAEAAVSTLGTIRREEGTPERFVTALAEAHAHGVAVDWEPLFAGSGAAPAELPYYAFERRHYWLPSTGGPGDVASLGLTGGDHPLIGASLTPAGRDERILTARLSRSALPWVGDHVVLGTVVVPGTALAELALQAGARAGCDALEEVAFEAPLVLGESPVVLQATVAEPDEGGRRAVEIYSRPADDEDGEPQWTRHASGLLAPAADEAPDAAVARLAAEAWPPDGAEAVEAESLYDELLERGFEYGPAFQGVGAAWRRGSEVFAEVALDEAQQAEAARFGLHPALFDAALHGLHLLAGPTDDERLPLPFAWSGVRIYGGGATSLRVRLTTDDDGGPALCAVDAEGAPLLSIESLVTRPVDRRALSGARAGATEDGSLLRVEWRAVPAAGATETVRVAAIGDAALAGVDDHYSDLDALTAALAAGGPEPDLVVASASPGGVGGGGEEPGPGVVPDGAGSGDGEGGTDPYAPAESVLALLQAWLGDERPGRLVVLTRGALAVGDEAPDPALAGALGLVRSAQAEHPGRLLALDLDPDPGADPEVDWASVAAAEEVALALRGGELHAERIVAAEEAPAPSPLDPDGSVLITGGAGKIGLFLARHLALEHGVRHLILVSRGTAGSDAAEEVAAELAEHGCEVELRACDVADRRALAALIDSVPPEHPLTAVVHAAGVLDDATVNGLTAAQLREVMRPKVEGARNLHELTAGLGLARFVLFSSASALLGSAGQGNYAAANAYLEALAATRRSAGLPATSIAWGLWREASRMTEGLDAARSARIARLGMTPLETERALALFDAALGAGVAQLAALRLDRSVLRAHARMGVLSPLLGSLVQVPARRARQGGALARRLAALPEGEWDEVLVEEVRGQVATILGYEAAATVEPDMVFRDVGFDSLAAVELRNRLTDVAGQRLPATLAFDHPTPRAVAAFLRVRLEAAESAPRSAPARVARSEPIAIVGMGCRYPGAVGSPRDLWQLVASGQDAVSEFPDDRGWDLANLFDPDPDHRGTSYAREGGFLLDAGWFDAGFFGISRREAGAMDPQQRLILEVAWEALEDARIDPAALAGTDTSVLLGASSSGYLAGASGEAEGLSLTGTTTSVVSGRLAYSLGLEGAAVSLDTACSSSLVALHLACQALREGECSLALTGGVTVQATPGMYVEFSRQRGLSPDGRCKSFAAGADGTIWSEGAGVLVLERLSDAERGGHPVLAIVRGSAVNQDGASNGLSAPSGPSQERVIRQALANAGLAPSDVDAVEAHGTGTTLGDPIEAQAILSTYGQERADGPLRLGSIKSNMGHAVAAAGVAGVIKMVMALREGELPATLHVDEPTPHVDWSEGDVELLTAAEPWPRGERPRRAGVSSFGISGTNAHVIVEEPPPPAASTEASARSTGDSAASAEDPAASAEDSAASTGDSAVRSQFAAHGAANCERTGSAAVALPISARTEPAMRAQAERLRDHLVANPDLDPADVAFSLAATRGRFERRGVVTGADREQLLAGLDALADGEPAAGVHRGLARATKTAFLFSGQGAQRPGMGLGLAEAFPVFAEAFEATAAALEVRLDLPLREIMAAPEGSEPAALLDRTEVTQAALFAHEVALFRLLDSLGLRPDYLIGHSIGELVAAHVAGVLSPEDAATLVAARGRLMGALPEGGAMLAVEAREEEIGDLPEGVSLAAVNSPTSLVLSGEGSEIDRLEAEWREKGRRVSRLRVSHAFHSPLMEPMLDEFREVATTLDFNAPRIPIVSNLTGALVGEEMTDPEYWVRHVREPVRLADGVAVLADAGVGRYLELGPDSVLAAPVAESLEGARSDVRSPEGALAPITRQASAADPLVACAQRSGTDQAEALLAFLARAHADGAEVDWAALYKGAQPVDLPTYAFQRERYWLSGSGRGSLAHAGLQSSEHPLIAAATPLGPEDEWLFTGRISLATHPWIGDHAIFDTALLPGTGFLEIAAAAARRLGCEAIEELTLEAPIVLPADGAVLLQLRVEAGDAEGRRAFTLYSNPERPAAESADSPAEWARCASGTLAAEAPGAAPPAAVSPTWPPQAAQPLDVEGLYDRLADVGLAYGPAFRLVRAAWQREGELFVEVGLDADGARDAASFALHPALLDAALHPGLLADGKGSARLPFSWRGVRVHRPGAGSLRVRIAATGEDAFGIAATDELGAPVLTVESVAGRPVEAGQIQAAGGTGDPLYRLSWPAIETGAPPASIALLGDPGELAPDLLPEGSAHYADLGALVAAIAAGADPPDVLLVPAPAEDAPHASAAGDPEDAACPDPTASSGQDALVQTLALLQDWLAADAPARTRLALVTTGAFAVAADERPSLAQAPLAGLLRSAQAEHPGRFALVDVDRSAASWRALPAALGSDEPQLALREGTAHAPRLVRAVADPGAAADGTPRDPDSDPAPRFDPDGTVLVTGGTGAIGGAVARHLATAHGVRHLLLVSRGGGGPEGAAELLADLAAAGCDATLAACDVSDRARVQALLDSIPPEHPLTAVIHAAGTLEDGTVDSLDAAQLRRVLAPKAEAARHLHELTRDLPLREFVVFSSAAATIGSPGQGAYSAANAYLDALAGARRAEGLPGRSLAWGVWDDPAGMAGQIGAAGMERLRRLGLAPLDPERALALLDAALASDEALLVPVALDLAKLREHGRLGVLPAPLRALVRAPARAAGAGELARELAAAEESRWDGIVLGRVRAHVAAVIGEPSPEGVDPQRPFNELGFDSLAAVELRNRLDRDTGLRLPATLVFDHPTATAVAAFLRARLTGAAATERVVVRQGAVADEPIAIIGMSCRYPGGVGSPEELWEMLAAGRDGISPFPADRGWDLDRLYDPDPTHLGTSYAREGGFVDDAAAFDAEFFSVTPREALSIDPQQRLLLEGTWEACERARIAPTSLLGSDTGVFAGVMYQDYGVLASASTRREEIEGYLSIGSAGGAVCGRVAYALGLEGPALTIDTACSSSLVAIHEASQALRHGECSLALAGGVTVLATPTIFVEFSRQRGLSPDGRCKSFGADADGTGWGEGVGLLLLERLSDAERNGHRVLATVRGSAVNQDGASNGLTAPNGPSQERVIRQALANAGLRPGDVDAVEAHGTGTSLGDPIEAGALLATYGQERANGPLRLGSIKSNIGHTQAAAGVAGVIKMVMALREGELPATLHAEEPSPHVDWSAGAVELLHESEPWPAGEDPRRAGISSFGISGTNAHVIVEEPPPPAASAGAPAASTEGPAASAGDPAASAGDSAASAGDSAASAGDSAASAGDSAASPEDSAVRSQFAAHGAANCERPGSAAVALPVSGRTEAAMRAQAERLRDHLVAHPDLDPADVAFSLAATREAFEGRGVVIGADRDRILAGLGALASGEPGPGVHGGRARSTKTAYMFSGQGAQRPGMGLGLAEALPVFAEAFEATAAALEGRLDLPLREIMAAPEGSDQAALLDDTEVTQAALFAHEVALFRLLDSLGLRPDFLVGHSIGELVAAHVAGVLSLEDAATLVAARGRLMGALPEGGAMLAVEAREEEIGDLPAGVSLAAVNSPTSLVLSGHEAEIDQLEAEWREKGRRVSRLRVSHAFHSPLMEPMLDEFREIAAGLEFQPPRIPIVSNLTGALVGEEMIDPEYWVRHVRQPVRLADGVAALADAGVGRFLELGPDSVLAAPVAESLEGARSDVRSPEGALAPITRQASAADESLVACAQRSGTDQAEALLAFLAHAHADGAQVDWAALYVGAELVDLPTYAFQRERFWPERDLEADSRDGTGHPLLGRILRVAARDEWLLSGQVSLSTHPWLADHGVLGTVLVPGTFFVELALLAGERTGCGAVEELTIEAPLVLAEGEVVTLQALVGEPDSDGRRELAIHSRIGDPDADADDAEPWRSHAEGTLAVAPAGEAALFGEAWPPAGAEPLAVDALYEGLAATGFSYGPAFQGVRAAWRRGEEVFAEVALAEPETAAAGRLGIHPALLDSTLHALIGAHRAESGTAVPVPFSWQGVQLHAAAATSLRVRVTPAAEDELRLAAYDASGAPVLTVGALRSRPIDAAQLAAARRSDDALYELAWNPVALPGVNGAPLRLASLGGEPVAGIADRFDAPAALAEAIGDGAAPPDLVIALAPPGAGAFGESPADGADRPVLSSSADGLDRAAAPPSPSSGADLAATAIDTAAWALDLLQAWIADERLGRSRLALATRGAVAVDPGEVPDPAAAAIWGLVRSAQSEHPDRFLLVDLDPGEDVPWPAIAACEEPQLALRGERAHVPRLRSAPAAEPASSGPDSLGTDLAPDSRATPPDPRATPLDPPGTPLDPRGTTLITGGTGGLGALLARHLVTAHGARHLLLLSRSGPEAPGAAALVAELGELGATATVARCDIADPADLAAAVDSIPAEQPLTNVIHAAGVLDDGTIGSLTPERLRAVMRPKVAGAANLAALAAGAPLSSFVVFSSATATLGSPGQGNYAAANAWLDAFAAAARAGGLPVTSLAWGLWAEAGGMGGGLDAAAVAQIGRLGIVPLAAEQGLGLFDAALRQGRSTLLPMLLDLPALRAQARNWDLPGPLRGLVGNAARRPADAGPSLAERLAAVPEEQRDALVTELVAGHVAAVLGYESGEQIDPARTFEELGFDSLGAVELRNRLSALLGGRLSATLVFDYPTVAAVAGRLRAQVGDAPEPARPIDVELDHLERELAALGGDEERERVNRRLQRLLAATAAPLTDSGVQETIESGSAAELFALLDEESGS